MSFWQRLRQKLSFFGADYVGVFVLALAVYGFVNWSPTFLDPDSYYHVKMAQLLARDGIVRDFIWLPFTTLSHSYADHHFLYHALMIPFLVAFGPLVGAKVVTVTLAAAAVTAFYAALKEYQVRYPFAFALLLTTTGSFVLRINLTKTSAISVCVLMLALIAVRRGKPMALFALSWLYVWLYGGWPILLLVVGSFLVARAFADRLTGKHPLHSWGHLWFWKRLLGLRRNAVADFFCVRETRLALAAGAGLLAGIVINPYFPSNLRFYWEQIFHIAVVNYRETIGVGAEWYPYPPEKFFAETSALILFILVIAAVNLAMLLWPEITKRNTTRGREAVTSLVAASLMAALFLALTLRSRRHVEYFVPFATFAAALAYTAMHERLDTSRFLHAIDGFLPKSWRKKVSLSQILICYMVVALAFIGARHVYLYAKLFRGGIKWTKYDRVAEWMASNVPSGAVIIHSDWDQFPPLFYRNDSYRFICGLDPTFLYHEDEDRYWLWVNMSTGNYSGDVAAKAQTVFNSRFFFVDSRYAAMRRMLEKNPDVVRLYHDDEADIYGTR